jgi:hypothetical protein
VKDSLRPQAGARFVLELERASADGTQAEYRVAIHTPDATYEGRAILVEDGTATVETTGASEDLVATLKMIAKLTARSAPKKREDGLSPWPQRVMRWRGPGRGE